jgi:hypothetical protein
MNDDPTVLKAAADDQSDPASLRLAATAYHEAGHAVMALSLGRLIQKVTILPGKSQFGEVRLGACEIRKGRSKASKDLLEDEALILLAAWLLKLALLDSIANKERHKTSAKFGGCYTIVPAARISSRDSNAGCLTRPSICFGTNDMRRPLS